MSEETVYCAGCGCELAPYEVFAARIRGVRPPICMGCAFDAVVFLKKLYERLGPVVKVERLERR